MVRVSQKKYEISLVIDRCFKFVLSQLILLFNLHQNQIKCLTLTNNCPLPFLLPYPVIINLHLGTCLGDNVNPQHHVLHSVPLRYCDSDTKITTCMLPYIFFYNTHICEFIFPFIQLKNLAVPLCYTKSSHLKK